MTLPPIVKHPVPFQENSRTERLRQEAYDSPLILVAALPSVPVIEVPVNNARKRKASMKHGRKEDGGSGRCALKTIKKNGLQATAKKFGVNLDNFSLSHGTAPTTIPDEVKA